MSVTLNLLFFFNKFDYIERQRRDIVCILNEHTLYFVCVRVLCHRSMKTGPTVSSGGSVVTVLVTVRLNMFLGIRLILDRLDTANSKT